MSELVYELDNGQYPHGEVTISLSEYRDLLDIQARTSILRCDIISELETTLENRKISEHSDWYSVRGSKISIEKICNTMGFLPTYRGFIERENDDD